MLVLLGDGPSKLAYMDLVEPRLRSRVKFLGHRSQSELPTWFRAADLFVFPSRHDGWGVVINEACAARLPIIASRQTGAVTDLVDEGVSGLLVERDDASGLANSMRQLLLASAETRQQMGARSRELVEVWSATAGAAKFAAYVVDLLSSGAHSAAPNL